MKEYLSLTQAAAYLGVCESKIRKSFIVWPEYGVKIYGNIRNMKFKKSELDIIKEKKIYG